MRRRRFSKQKIPPLNIPLAISNSRQLDSEQTGTPRNEAPAVPTSLPKGPQSSINVYLKIVPAASTSTSTWPLAPTSAPVPPVTFFVRVFCFFEVKVERRTRSEGRNRKEVRAESGGESPREREEKKTKICSGGSRFHCSLSLPLCSLSLSALSLFSSYSPQARVASSSRCRRPWDMSQRPTSREHPRTPEPFQRPPRWSRRRCRQAARPRALRQARKGRARLRR